MSNKENIINDFVQRGHAKVVLTRRNLETLLEKLNHNKNGGDSLCSIIKSDTVHPKHPLVGVEHLIIQAVEDEDYYTDRNPGPVLGSDGQIK